MSNSRFTILVYSFVSVLKSKWIGITAIMLIAGTANAQLIGYNWNFIGTSKTEFNSTPAVTGSTATHTLTKIGSGSFSNTASDNIGLGTSCTGSIQVRPFVKSVGLEFLNSPPRVVTNVYTIEMVINLSDANIYRRLMGFRDLSGAEKDKGIYVSETGAIDFYNGTSHLLSASPLAVNTWYHLVFTRDASNVISYYRNGVLVGTYTDSSNDFIPNAAGFYIVTFLKDDTGDESSGKIARVGIFNEPLPLAAIQQRLNTICSTTDIQAPSSFTLSSSGQTESTISLSWTAATDNVGVTGYDVYVGGVLNGTTTTNTYTVTGLTPSTQYGIYVKAKDAAGNGTNSNTVTPATSTATDSQAPSSFTLSSPDQTASAISLSWTAATDNVGVTGYDVYVGGALKGTTAATTYTVTGLTVFTQYSIYVKAKDAAGNSTNSNTITATTASGIDTIYRTPGIDSFFYEKGGNTYAIKDSTGSVFINGTGFLKANGTTVSYDTSTYLTTDSAASAYQPLDSNLTTIAGLTATTDNFIVGADSTWASRTPAQVKATLGATTVGNNLFTLANPSSNSYIKINADNSITTRTAAEMLSDIGALASGSYALLDSTQTFTGSNTFSNAVNKFTGLPFTDTTQFIISIKEDGTLVKSTKLVVDTTNVIATRPWVTGLINNSALATVNVDVGYQSSFTGSIGAANVNNSNFYGHMAGFQATNASYSNFFGNSTGIRATNASSSNFFGIQTGYEATNASGSNFMGDYAGQSATSANLSNFFGASAGRNASSANNSNFFGLSAGYNATYGSHSNFVGNQAGFGATNANNSNFLGQEAGVVATNASNSNFFGTFAGYAAENARNSIFLGQSAGNETGLSSNRTNNGTNDYSILLGRYTRTGGFKNSILLGGSINTTYINNTADNQFMLAPNITKLRFNSFDYNLAADTLATRSYARSISSIPTLMQVITAGSTINNDVTITGGVTDYWTQNGQGFRWESYSGGGDRGKLILNTNKQWLGFGGTAGADPAWGFRVDNVGTPYVDITGPSGEVRMSNITSAITANVLYYDATGKRITYGALGSNNQTLQQVFNTQVGGSVMTKTDTILLGSNALKVLASGGSGTAFAPGSFSSGYDNGTRIGQLGVSPGHVFLSSTATNEFGASSSVTVYDSLTLQGSHNTSGHESRIILKDNYLRFLNDEGNYYFPNMVSGVGTKSVRFNPETGKFTYADTTIGGVPAITANNGLTKNSATNVQLGGTLIQNTTVTGGSFITAFSSTVTGGSSYALNAFNSSTGNAFIGQASSGTGVSGVATSSGTGVYASSVTGLPLFAAANPSSTNTVHRMFTLRRNSSGTGANSIGGEIGFEHELNNGSSSLANSLISKWTETTPASRVSQFIITGVNNAVTADIFTLSGNGALQLNKYGAGTHTGTPAYTLAVDASGNVIEGPAGIASSTPTYTFANGLTKTDSTVKLGGVLQGFTNIQTGPHTFVAGTNDNYLSISPSASNLISGNTIEGTSAGISSNGTTASLLGEVKLNNYPITRNDGAATKFITVDSAGKLQLKGVDFNNTVFEKTKYFPEWGEGEYIHHKYEFSDTSADDLYSKYINEYYSGGVLAMKYEQKLSSYGQQEKLIKDADNWSESSMGINQYSKLIKAGSNISGDYINYNNNQTVVRKDSIQATISMNIGNWIDDEPVLELRATKQSYSGMNTGNRIRMWKDSTEVNNAPFHFNAGAKFRNLTGGTAVKYLALDSSNNTIQVDAPAGVSGIDSTKWSTDSINIFNKNIGNVGIGTITPTAKFHTLGSLRFESFKNNLQGDSVLTTDANGNLKLIYMPYGSGSGSGASYTFENGVAQANGRVSIGGSLLDSVKLNLNAHPFHFNSGSNSVFSLSPNGSFNNGNANYDFTANSSKFNIGTQQDSVGYGSQLYFNGLGNSDGLWMSRYNSSIDASELRVNVGDDGGSADKFHVGYLNGGTWKSNLVVQANGQAGIGTAELNGDLSVGTQHGDKLSIGNNSWANKTIIATGTDGQTGDYTELKVPGAQANSAYLRLNKEGSVGIGTTKTDAGYKLLVNGRVKAVGMRVQAATNWPDYVFDSVYQLRPLSEVEKFIKANKHLPEMQTAAEVEKDGHDVSETQIKLLQKIEELTLYVIEQDKRLQEMEQKNKKLKEQNKQITQVQQELEELKKLILNKK